MHGYMAAGKLRFTAINVRYTSSLNSFLSQELGFSRKALHDLRAKYPTLESNGLDSCKETVDLLRTKFRFSNTNIRSNAKLLTKRPFALLHCYHYLTEGGFNTIKPYDVLHFYTITNKPISQLKKFKVIEKDCDVVEQFLKHVPNKYRDFTIRHETRKGVESLALYQVSEMVLVKSLSKACLANECEIQQRINLYPRLRRKSVQIVHEVVDFLLEKCRFLKSDVVKHIYLLNYDYRAMQTVIDTIDEIGGIPIMDFIRKNPYMLIIPAPKTQQVLKFLSDNRLDSHFHQKNSNVYFLNMNTISKRLEMINTVPELRIYRESREVMKVLNDINKVVYRLKYVQDKNMPTPGIQKLVVADFHFKKFLLDGIDWAKQRDILEFLSRELRLPLEKLSSLDRNASGFTPININSNWKHTRLLTIQENISYFRSLGYSISDLQQYPIILFYPTQKLKDVRKKIVEKNPNISKQQILYIMHYLIEKKYHFSGILMRNSNNINASIDD